MATSEYADDSPASPESGIARPAPAPRRGWAAVNRWLEDNTWLPVLAVVAGGLLARILVALPTALNPDEAMHVLRSSEPTMLAFYRADLTGPDPSFLHVLLFPLCKLYASDFVLRLPSIIAGTLTIFFGYKWLAELFDRTTGLIGAILLAFAPSVVFISAEVRAYALVLCFSVWALYSLEAAIRRRSITLMLLFGLAQCLALVSQYSALIVLFVAGCYSLYLVIRGRIRGRVLWAWLIAELATVGLLAFLYVTHLSKLHGGPVEASVRTGFLSNAYFNPAREAALSFVASRTVAAFGFLFTSPRVGIAALILFLAGVAWLLARGITKDGGRGRREVSFLLVAPWALAVAGGILALYPFAGTRHIVFLIIPTVAGIAYLIRQLTGRRPAVILFAALVLVPLWDITRLAYAGGWLIIPYDVQRSRVTDAVRLVRQEMPDGGIIFSDLESDYVFRHYLFQGHTGTLREGPAGFGESDWNGFRMITLNNYYEVSADSFGNAFRWASESYGLEPGTAVCVVSCSWDQNLARRLRGLGLDYPAMREFGRKTAVLVIPVGFQVMTEDLTNQMELTGQTLYSLASGLSQAGGKRVKTVFWPSSYFGSNTEQLTDRLGLVTMSYRALFELAASGQMVPGDLLPGLAFWVVGTRERQVPFMRYMEDGDNYISNGLRFTLLGRDRDGLVLAYLIEDTATPQRLPSPLPASSGP